MPQALMQARDCAANASFSSMAPTSSLLKDVGLLRGEVGALPAEELNGDVEQAILQARALLGSGSARE
ncbi:hypothetical protein NicSoilB8_20590 [Arthrobacter sp. NicSoilB8]|nr:hypothetical protein NicSoilB8_20590 [Arthrobacter sp. NicSoilB8]